MKNLKLEGKKRAFGGYLSHRIQEEMIELIGEYLQDVILDRVRGARYFSLMVDEARDTAGETKQTCGLFPISVEKSTKWIVGTPGMFY